MISKRVLDVVAAATGLLLLLPLFAVLAVCIKLDSRGPVFFRQERVGRHGRPFRIFKFRTMAASQPGSPKELTVAGDARITRVGAVLRRYKLDELPQLIDVLRGTMSLVGPRPEVPRYVAHYPPALREKVLRVRPGITDFASVRFRNENELLARAVDPEQEYIDVILPSKLRYAVDYVDNASVLNDLRVLGLTMRTVFVPAMPLARRILAMHGNWLWIRLDQQMSALRPSRRFVVMAVDAVIVMTCWHLTYLFRLGFERWQPGRPWYDDYVAFGVTIAYIACLAITGSHRGLWRFVGFDDFKRIIAACITGGLLSAVTVLLAQLSGVARAVLLLHPLFCIIALSMARMAYRVVWEHARSNVTGAEGELRRAIVLGAGEAARRLIAGMHRRDGWVVLALLDDDPAKQGIRLNGIPVIGTLSELLRAHISAGATHVIVAMPGAAPEQRERAIMLAKETGLPVLTVPSQAELRGEPGEHAVRQ